MSGRPIEPAPSVYRLPDPADGPVDDVIAVGGDLAPGTVLQGYRKGLFPMRLPDGPLAWWSPWERGILPTNGLRVTRSLRRSIRRYRITFDGDFEGVVDACADPSRPNGWITPAFRTAYVELHRLGWTHSVEAWAEDGALAGGLYGVVIGGLFAGESMFHRQTDASKVALVALVDRMSRIDDALLDVQWVTPHLRSLGAVGISRSEYLRRLEKAIAVDPGVWETDGTEAVDVEVGTIAAREEEGDR